MLRILKSDEKFPRATSVVGQKVQIARTVKASKDAKEIFAVQAAIDFAGVKPEELLQLAVATVWIDVQTDFRAHMASGKKPADFATNISVRDMLDRETTRGPIDPQTRFVNAAKKMGFTDAMIADMIAKKKK